jgi:uracil-DNA glycosylase family 4
MRIDPRESRGSFDQLLRRIRECKAARTCPSLTVRSYYFEPNPVTAGKWRQDGMYQGKIDRRVVFVCESPGPSGRHATSIAVRRCWAESPRDRRFREILKENGFHHCYITNTLKCGVRQGRRHTDKEIANCTGFLVRELELLQPMIVVAVGGNALHTLRAWALPQMAMPAVLFQVTHYAARGNPREVWGREFPELVRLLSRLKPRGKWRR